MPRKLPGGGQPPPAKGGSGPPTGNALSDAQMQAILAASAQVTAAVAGIADTANQQLDAVASDCMWPPSGQVTVPLIPGVWSQTFQTPCLLTYSEARAVFAVGLIIAGAQLILTGAGIMVAVEVLPPVLAIAGLNKIAGGGGKAAQQPAPSPPVYTGNSPSGTTPPPAPTPASPPSPPVRKGGPTSQPKAKPRTGGRTQQGTGGSRRASTAAPTKKSQGLAGP